MSAVKLPCPNGCDCKYETISLQYEEAKKQLGVIYEICPPHSWGRWDWEKEARQWPLSTRMTYWGQLHSMISSPRFSKTRRCPSWSERSAARQFPRRCLLLQPFQGGSVRVGWFSDVLQESHHPPGPQAEGDGESTLGHQCQVKMLDRAKDSVFQRKTLC